jgi:hypothetical protein
MDDTNWIARSHQNMENILKEAREFYIANDSQINSNKSILITINSSNKSPNTVHAGMNCETVTELDRKLHARFLGIWLGNKKNKKDIIPRIKQEIRAITTVLQKKKITDKQTTYILNRVLIPRIKYRMQHCNLQRITCNTLTTIYRKILKNKALICGTMPNSVIHNKEIYGLKSIWEIQLESQITSLLHSLNENGPTGLSTIIRLKQAQINNWEPTNILEDGIPKYFNTSGNLPAEIIKNANDLGIKFKSDLY